MELWGENPAIVLDLDLPRGGSNLQLTKKVTFVSAGEPLPAHLMPNKRYAQIAAACRASGMDIADDDFELIDAMSEDRPDDEPGFVEFIAPNVLN